MGRRQRDPAAARQLHRLLGVAPRDRLAGRRRRVRVRLDPLRQAGRLAPLVRVDNHQAEQAGVRGADGPGCLTRRNRGRRAGHVGDVKNQVELWRADH